MSADLIINTKSNPKSYPSMELAQLIFELESSSGDVEEVKGKIMEFIITDEMCPMYTQLCDKFGWEVDATVVESLTSKNTVALAAIDAQEAEAAATGGDLETIDVLLARARYFTRIGNFPLATAVYDDILARPKTITSKKLDSLMEKCRICLFLSDSVKLKALLAETKKAIELGGDWDRRNRLKMYEALSLVLHRDLKAAATLLAECIATFTCVELCSYEQFMFYTVILSVATMNRTQLNKTLIVNPQVIAVLRTEPVLKSFLQSIYDCDYSQFFQSMLQLQHSIQVNRYLGTHSNFLIRELRILAYSQFLEAYKSVKMSSMASAFGMSVDLLDIELSRFIATGKINAKVDKVGDVVVTNRPDAKNAQYQTTIKKGDQLLNQIQRLVRVLDA